VIVPINKALSLERVSNKLMDMLPESLSLLVNRFVKEFAVAEIKEDVVILNGQSFSIGSDSNFKPRLEVRESVGIIPVEGPIFNKSAGWFDQRFGFSSYEEMKMAFIEANTDPNIQAIVFQANSPGGEAAGMVDFVDYIHENKSKPVYAIIDDAAYSAAYGVVSSADEIFTTRSGGVGSVGTIIQHVDFSKADEKNGYTVTEVYAGAEKTLFSPNKPLSEKAKERLQEMVDSHYLDFVGAVAKGRRMESGDVVKTQARTFKGQEGVTAGFADKVMSVDDAFLYIKSKLTKKEVKTTMDLKEMQDKHPELYAQIVESSKVAAEAEKQIAVDAAKKELEDKITSLEKENLMKEAAVKGMDVRMQTLEKTQIETLSKSIWKEVLNDSELPDDDFKSKVQGISKIDAKTFIIEGVFNESGFKEAVKAEVSDWEAHTGKFKVLGMGKTGRNESEGEATDEAWLSSMWNLSNPPDYEKTAYKV